ncbi:YicC/YloC family endoribonuclease [Geofilum rubicundum]|nr:YicC/YloC family endoribonuclease [Geofilum rubicundum]
MIKSMTGFGKTTCELPEKKIHIEIKSLNSKQLDLNLRLPTIYREKELEMRNRLSAGLQRGKVDISITIESLTADRVPQINEQVFEHYYKQLSQLSDKLQISSHSDYIRTILTLPETLKVEQAELDAEEWKTLQDGLAEAIASINQYRRQEGAALYDDITARIHQIDTLSQEVVPFEKQRIERIKSRIKENLDEWNEKNIDENRFEQELIYYLEKLDITEEKVRLKNHIDYFNETIAEDEPVGKKLAFIIQEIGREINTLGSKANDADIQRLVIRMKDELEKIKEQMLNIL